MTSLTPTGRFRREHKTRPRLSNEDFKAAYRKIRGVPAHRVIVERRIGMKLPDYAIVHHVNPDDKKTNNGPFVVCQDVAYHALLEYRGKALRECGNANWMRCYRCGKWDEPGHVIASPRKQRRRGTFGDVVHPKKNGVCFTPPEPIARDAYTCHAAPNRRHKVQPISRVKRHFVRHGLAATCCRCGLAIHRPHDRALRWYTASVPS